MPKIVIVGAGIIGSATAYYLTQHARFGPDVEVTLLEAVEPGAGASGKAGGLLSRQAFPSSLAGLSFKLHAELAAKHDGADAWGYRGVHVLSVEGSNESAAGGRGGKRRHAKLPQGLDWVDDTFVTSADVLGGPEAWAQAHPHKLTNFLANAAAKAGVKIIRGRARHIVGNKDAVSAVVYEPTAGGKPVRLEADQVVVTAGPWTSTLLAQAPVIGIKANSITVDPGHEVSPFAMFTELEIDGVPSSPEIYPRRDEIYVCGAATEVALPALASEVRPDIDDCEGIFRKAALVSPAIAKSKLTRQQACFLPVVESARAQGPFVGVTNVPNLYIAAGHTVWGINNGPATGLLMSEIILDGKARSSNIRGLSPIGHFDAAAELLKDEGVLENE